MCGIAGAIGWKVNLDTLAINLLDGISRRGPDGVGVWTNQDRSIVIAHTRLAILELSDAGRQPMISSNGRYILSFNGEIYNHSEIRREIDALNRSSGINWRGRSDTETLLEAFSLWGLDALVRCVGMYSASIYDVEKDSLYLFRDRFGEKPLYYHVSDSGVIFSSSLRSIQNAKLVDLSISENAADCYFSIGYITGRGTIYSSICRVMPNEILEIKLASTIHRSVESKFISAYMRPKTQEIIDESFESLVDVIHSNLEASIKQQLIADVPVGLFLSSGVDSSLIAAIASKISSSQVTAYTIAFDDPNYDESGLAETYAKTLGITHRKFLLTENEATKIITERLPWVYDEPFADNSQVPTFFLTKCASSEVKVCLSGDGADELFCGYSRYFNYLKIRSYGDRINRFTGKCISSNIHPLARTIFGLLGKNAESKYGPLIRALTEKSSLRGYAGYLSKMDSDYILSSVEDYGDEMKSICHARFDLDISTGAAMLDTLTYLPDDILVKVDRAAMYHGLETRAPFLDRNLSDTLGLISPGFHHDGKSGKKLLKHVLRRVLPEFDISRKKRGFGIPLQKWLSSGARDWAISIFERPDDYIKRNIDYVPLLRALKSNVELDHFQASDIWSGCCWINWKIGAGRHD